MRTTDDPITVTGCRQCGLRLEGPCRHLPGYVPPPPPRYVERRCVIVPMNATGQPFWDRASTVVRLGVEQMAPASTSVTMPIEALPGYQRAFRAPAAPAAAPRVRLNRAGVVRQWATAFTGRGKDGPDVPDAGR